MVGSCEGPAFTSAGGHLNPGARQHGTLNPAGSHTGDLPNLTVTSNGTGTLSAELSGTKAELEAALFDADGTALVIHAAADDYKTDPTGNSGARIACGVLKRG
jgi:Cu-Zn family superoxide dismutase